MNRLNDIKGNVTELEYSTVISKSNKRLLLLYEKKGLLLYCLARLYFWTIGDGTEASQEVFVGRGGLSSGSKEIGQKQTDYWDSWQ